MFSQDPNDYDQFVNEDEPEKNCSGFLIWFFWAFLTVLGEITFTVSLISVVFFALRMESTQAEFEQSTIMTAPATFSIDTSLLPPPVDALGLEWGVLESLLLESATKEDDTLTYFRIDPIGSHDSYAEQRVGTKLVPPESLTQLQVFVEGADAPLGANVSLAPTATFSTSGIKSLLTSTNKFLSGNVPARPVIITHTLLRNVYTIGGIRLEFDSCFNQNCEVSDQYVADGATQFSVIGWTDKFRSKSSFSNGDSLYYVGGFIVRRPSSPVGHTPEFFLANYSGTVENKLCPNQRLFTSWKPVRIDLKPGSFNITNVTLSYGIIDQTVNGSFESDDPLLAPTILVVNVTDSNVKNIDQYVESADLSTNLKYFVVTTYPEADELLRTTTAPQFNITVLECPLNATNATHCVLKVLYGVTEELLLTVFRPSTENNDYQENKPECQTTLLPYATLLKMNFLLHPNRVYQYDTTFSYSYVAFNPGVHALSDLKSAVHETFQPFRGDEQDFFGPKRN